ncbi:uncharacterized protein TNCV_2410101 [Trichonephila clavipes]|nr:uncharacterized protein TNCV_2410101 [Trichonephila clavipes]
MGSLMVKASDSRPEGLVQCRNCGGGDRWCRHLSSLPGISPSKIVLFPVWCSRPTTGVLLAPCHDKFRGPRSDYVRQSDMEEQVKTKKSQMTPLKASETLSQEIDENKPFTCNKVMVNPFEYIDINYQLVINDLEKKNISDTILKANSVLYAT